MILESPTVNPYGKLLTYCRASLINAKCAKTMPARAVLRIALVTVPTMSEIIIGRSMRCQWQHLKFKLRQG